MRSNVAALLKRGKFALEDSEWERAFDFCGQVLNCDAECAEDFDRAKKILAAGDIMVSEVIYAEKFSHKYEYSTYTEARRKQLDDMIDYLETDKLLKKAVRFSKDGSSADVARLKEGVIPVMEERLVKAKEQDALAEAEI